MSKMSKAMLDDYTEIATRKLHKALNDRCDAIDPDAALRAYLKLHNATKQYEEYIKLDEKYKVLEIMRDELKEELVRLVHVSRYRSGIPENIRSDAKLWAIQNDPLCQRIHAEIQRIKDAIYLAPAPDKIVALIESMDLSFIEEASKKAA